MTAPIIPPLYRTPFHVPAYWRDEQSGVLVAAVQAYFAHRESAEQLAWVIAYARYWINAPCWAGPGLQGLREAASAMRTRTDVRRWLDQALALGIDPF